MRRPAPAGRFRQTFVAPQAFVALQIVLALVIGGIVLPAQAQDGMRPPAGYILALDSAAADPDAASHILREGQEVPVQIGGALFAGDQVVVADPTTAVTIETAGDGQLRIDAARSPHPVKGELPTGGRLSALAALIGELFQSKPEARTVNLIGRTDPELRLTLGRGVPQRVVAGAPLWVGWSGGVAPFAVTIGAAGAPPLARVEARTPAARLDLPAGTGGPLVLTVRDAQGAEARIDLVAGPPPELPDWIATGTPTPDFAKVAGALWLIERQPAEWDLYAAALAAQAGDYPAAQELLRRLAAGERPAP
ncbi:hypothetical protein [Ancylobacter terrae]|uniref:hypothetical protein n=1 Tax=Ancylobacter sp. sgz301288 TaxID=3342077 RepID=UPI00385C11B0